MTQSGQISIHAENILPIIKKWLYSEKEIFIRELVSNCSDAIQKFQKVAMLGEVDAGNVDAKITVTIDKDKRTLTITDTGIGMTEEEVKKYINQVAFSSLEEFVDKYQDKDLKEQNIGHFGLGFYSAFMVADRVEIDTLSCQKDAAAVHWSCDGSINYTISKSSRKEVGSSVILHISEANNEMLNEENIRALLLRFCAFIKFPIELAGEIINDPEPLWTKSPSQLKDEDYLAFFHKLFPLSTEPLFWIHLNVDFPFKLKGILYFPKLQHEMEASQGDVKMYCNQVFVAENSKELLPEWLTLLKGAIDCPELPLNVSRSYLQNDPEVKKISAHIIKKVADKLNGLAKTERENFEKCWDDIHGFVKFGMLRDESFYDRMIDNVIFKSSNGSYTTMDAYLERMQEKTEGKIIYVSDPVAQASYVKMLEEHGLEAVIADTMIDTHFIQYLEMKSSRKYKFSRIDSEVSKHLLSEDTGTDIVDPSDNMTAGQKVEELFNKYMKATKVKVRVEKLKTERIPALLLLDENTRRFKEMSSRSGGAGFNFPGSDELTLVVNQNSGAVKNLLTLAKSFNRSEDVELIVNQILDLAYLQKGELNPEMMQGFVDRSATILEKLAKGELTSTH